MRETCDGCPLEGRLLCLHTPRDAFDFAFLAISFFIPFLAGKAIGGFWLGFALWVVLEIILLVYVEALVLCRHWPHAEERFTLSCHANSGLPKIPRVSRRPLSQVEKILFLGYVAVLGLYYVPFFVLSQQWLLLAITSWAVITWGWTLLRTQCTRCYHVSSPLNRVPADVREELFNNYPAFSEARMERQP